MLDTLLMLSSINGLVIVAISDSNLAICTEAALAPDERMLDVSVRQLSSVQSVVAHVIPGALRLGRALGNKRRRLWEFLA